MFLTLAKDPRVSRLHPVRASGPLGNHSSEEIKESPWSFRRPALAVRIRGAHSGMLPDSQGVKAQGMSDKAGTNNQLVLIKLQPNVAWTVPFKETPVGCCRRGQERSGDIKPKCSVPPNDKLLHYSTNA